MFFATHTYPKWTIKFTSSIENCTISKRAILNLEIKYNKVKVFLNRNNYYNANPFEYNRIDMMYILLFILVRSSGQILSSQPKQILLIVKLIKAGTDSLPSISSPIFQFCLSLSHTLLLPFHFYRLLYFLIFFTLVCLCLKTTTFILYGFLVQEHHESRITLYLEGRFDCLRCFPLLQAAVTSGQLNSGLPFYSTDL